MADPAGGQLFVPVQQQDGSPAAPKTLPTLTGLADPAARHLARNGTRPHEGGHGLDWRYDPMHRVTFPHPFYVAHAQAFWRRIRCPVLLAEGDASPFAKLPDLDARRQALPHATRAAITGAGHMMHVEAPHEVAAALVALWRGC